MASNSPDPSPSRPSGLQAMLARLRGMVQALKTPEPSSEAARPEAPVPAAAAPEGPPPLPPSAIPVEAPPLAAPVATPVAGPDAEPGWDPSRVEIPPAEAAPALDSELAATPIGEIATLPDFKPPEPATAEGTAPAEPPAAPSLRPCPICSTPRTGQSWCESCGYMFPADEPPAVAASPEAPVPATASSSASSLRGGRYELGALLGERGGVARFRGLDRAGDTLRPVTIIRMEQPLVASAVEVEEPTPAVGSESSDEIMPSFDEPALASLPTTQTIARPIWPSIHWERELLEVASQPALPALVEHFAEGGFDYVVEELPEGRSLWDAWDDLDATNTQRFALLAQVAEALSALHHAGAILEGIRPELIVVAPDGRARLTDLGDLLPLPLPPGASLRGSLYTAPELMQGDVRIDARADLYSFGAMLYALNVGRELSETDFDRPGFPKPFLPHFPDIHPAFGRLLTKTFCRDVGQRFPTDEAGKADPTGFRELIRTLETCGRAMDTVRLEIASWTTTGMVRTGNEDAFALLHGVESRQDDLSEQALVLLADGMGGYEAGEIAAALAIQVLRKQLTLQKAFRGLAGGSVFRIEGQKDDVDIAEPADIEQRKKLILAALREANRAVWTASRSGIGKRGMGCTAEAVYVDGSHVVVGHVGDSRTYHLHEGRLIQLTRDQTLVNRLVELGTLTAEEAEHHPRRNELQQAIGGQPDVEPGLYHGIMRPGDWVVVCSDGLTNHTRPEELKHMLLSEATSAEMAARRLVNWANINGATDNATVVVIRAT